MMRVTQGMISRDLLRQLNNTNSKLYDLQQQLVTGKKITKPSQDPVIASLGIAYRTEVAQINQYSRNMDEVHNWMDNSESALDQANSVLQRIRELTVEASNDTYTDDQRKDIQKEVIQLKEQLVNIVNTKVAGKYIFNGTNTSAPPVTIDASGNVTTAYNANAVQIEVNNGIKIPVNVNPNDVFPQSLFDDIQDLESALTTTPSDGKQIGSFLDKIDQHIDEVVGARAELGARMNRVDMIDNRIGAQKQIAETMMANNEDAQFEQVLVDYQTQLSVQRAALAVGSKIIQPTLVDFLS
jgi:flagellar hook-associated protein 3 FlgL